MSTVMVLGKTPRYQELIETISGQIRSGELAPGARLPSFTEMREQQGVSQTTVVKVYAHLENEGLIRREPKRGIFVAPQERSRTGQIGFIGTAFARRNQVLYSAHLVDGIESVAQRENLRIVLLQNTTPVTRESVDGILINAPGNPGNNPSGVDIPGYLEKGIPVVAMLNAHEGVPCVVADDFGGAKMGVRRLIDMGHRRISALLQAFNPLVQLRGAGYRSALAEAGIPFDPAWLRDPGPTVTPAGYRAWGYVCMNDWLREGWRELGCTALFVQNDEAAMGVLEALREADIAVPRDLSVISFDGTEVCEFCWPRLAAVQVPLEQIGATSVEMLLRMARGENVEPVITVLPARWKDGDSVAPPRES